MKSVIFIHVLYLILIKTFMVKGVSKCESKVELRAVLLSCPTKDTGCEDDDLLSQAIKSEESQILQADSKNFDSLREEKERGFSNAVKDCKRKLVITLKIKNIGKIPCDDEYIVVDHVFDPVTGGRGRLLSPVVLKLRQEQMTHLYGLQFQRVVNSDPFEEHKASGRSCSVSPENPTCGIAMYDGKPIPFSEGFCCSCDSHVNAKRQLSPTTRGDSLLYRDYKMIPKENSHFVRDEKAAIVDPNLVKLKFRNSENTGGNKKAVDCGGFGDPLSWDKIPNYLLEHDRKVVCDRGDFMNELCKLQEDKYYSESGSSVKYQDKGDNKGRNKKSGDVRRAVDLNKQDLTTVAVDIKASKENFLKDDKAHDVILLKNFIKTLNWDQSRGSGASADNYSSVKGSRGKRENRNENKKLTLEEKLEKFVNSKSHLTSPRKRLLELSHKRRRKADERCLSGQECATVIPPEYPQSDYVRSPPPKYFFFHDKYIIDPLESPQVLNSSCGISKEYPYEEAKDKTFEFERKNSENQEEKMLSHSFHQRQSKKESRLKGKDKIILGKITGKKERVSHNEGGKIENSIGRDEMRAENFEEPMKISAYARSDKRLNLFKESVSEEKDGEVDIQRAKKVMTEDHPKEQKLNRLSSKTFKSLFRKSDSDEKFIKPKKIRNFFMAKNRERQKLKSELVKGHRKVEINPKDNESFKIKNFKERENKVSDSEAQEKKQTQDEENMSNKLIKEQGRDEDQKSSGDAAKEFDGSSLQVNFPKHSFNKEPSPQEEKEKLKGDEGLVNKMKENEKNYAKQRSEKITDSSRNHVPKEFLGDTDFSFEIIRRKYPEYSKGRYYSNHRKLSSNNRESNAPSVPDAMKKMGYQKNNPNFPVRSDAPQKYYLFENELTPPQMYIFQNDRKPFFEAQNRQRHFKGPQEAFYDSVRLGGGPEPEPNGFLLKKPLRHHRFPEYTDYDNDPTKSSQSFIPVDENKVLGAQERGKRFSDLSRRHEDGYIKIGFRPETFEGDLGPRLEKARSKRSASYSFQPARGFFKSEFDSRSPEDRIVHELETCASEPKAKPTAGSARPATWQFSRLKRENLSIDANGIFNSQRLQIGFNCPAVTSREKSIKEALDKQRLIQSYLNSPDYVLEEVEAALKEKRQAVYLSKLNGSRAGESAFAPEQEGQDIAHCMRFGDMWYNLYTIKQPVVSQTVGIQLFDKHLLWDGTSQWRDLTKGKMIRVGTFLPKAEDDLPSISVNFIGGNPEKSESAIDPDNYFLLVPSHVTDPSKINFYPQFDGGPGEYLLVQSKDVSSGDECNMVGTSFEAFARQPDRCNQRKGSCLKRQPVDLWREDMEARIRGKRGKYFVENFGTVPNSSIKTYTNFTGEFLALEYYGEYTSTIEIEVKADSNAVVRKGSNAQIPLVYIDSTYPKKTRIILSVLNIGLTSSYFRPRLGDCPPDLDPAWCPLEGPLVTIPPQQRHDFKLDLSGGLPSHQIFVSVQVLNQVNKKIASRKICIKKGDRCVCAFHCKCNCVGHSADDRVCRRLSLRDYRRAGYIGSFPFRGGSAAFTTENVLKNIHIMLLTASYVLLLFGVMKGILGIIIRRVGIAGIRVITGPRELSEYYESELAGCSILLDEYGFPVHPTTCQPVQIVPLWIETIMNFFFFFLYPLKGFWILLSSLPCCKALCSECDGCGRNNDCDSDRKSSRPLLSKGLSPTCVHYNLTTINSKKSKQDEYLPYPAYKGDDDPLEEDDTEFVLQEMKRYRKE